MMKFSRLCAGVLASFALLPSPGHTQEKVSPFAALPTAARKQNAGDFVLAASKAAAPIYFDANDYPVVQIAAEALAGDIHSVTAAKPSVLAAAPAAGETAVFIGTIGKSRLIDGLVAAGKLDVSAIRGQWERFVIATVENPLPGVRQALAIAGSDRRGTAFGAFSVSESIGVSPWVWWADVTPERRDAVVIPRTSFVSKAPSIKYRGIFINDEDWGLLPWASKKFEPEVGNIGPKTYARVGELLLRLKANYLWPAMHEPTTAFNQIPENKVVMDRYAIVMGSSHAEQMLFNNASEWKYPRNYWNYETHADLIKSVWEKRVQENGRYENSYTLGIRGIHDSPMQGGGTRQEGVQRLERVIADQRALLAKYVNPDLEQVAQIFVPYKEVLPYYQAGLKVPEDVTLVWVDDNFGFIRQLSNPAEQKRSGGSGVYYHFSYLGVPQEYLWIGSTSPALTAYEMGKAYAYGADRVWVFNVGDIKPIEKEMDFALRLAYDIDRYPADKAMRFLGDFAAQNFGAKYAAETAAVLTEYYRLTAQSKPEHNDRTEFSGAEQNQRLAAYAALLRRAESLYAGMPAARRDAFFELVLYPVKGAALMNAKHVYAARGDAKKAIEAYETIQQITLHYNKEIAGGKWDGVLRASPKNARVFGRPVVQTVSQESAPLIQLEPGNAELAGSMKRVNNTLVAVATGASPPELPSGSGNAARFRFESPRARPVSLYFLAQTVDDKHDSWHVSLNGQKVVCNDQVTGDEAGWIKVMDADLIAGRNSLVIEPRESGTVIHRVAILEAGKAPAQAKRDPDVILGAADYTRIENTAASRWQKIEGLGISGSAMTLLPYQSQPIDDPARAPAITYSFPSTKAQAGIEARFLPTQRVNEGMGLRYAIKVDDGPVEVRDINALEFARTWSRNVLNGYARGTTTHALKGGSSHTVTIRLLDPGMVLSQIRVFGP